MSDTPRTREETRWYESGIVHACFAAQLERELNEANERIKRLEDCIEGAWCLIANVSQGDWKLQHLHWQESVAQWMEKEMYPIYKEISKRKAKEAKP